jgi:hypothetical protein
MPHYSQDRRAPSDKGRPVTGTSWNTGHDGRGYRSSSRSREWGNQEWSELSCPECGASWKQGGTRTLWFVPDTLAVEHPDVRASCKCQTIESSSWNVGSLADACRYYQDRFTACAGANGSTWISVIIRITSDATILETPFERHSRSWRRSDGALVLNDVV